MFTAPTKYDILSNESKELLELTLEEEKAYKEYMRKQSFFKKKMKKKNKSSKKDRKKNRRKK